MATENTAYYNSPIGLLAIRGSNTHITAVHFLQDGEPHPTGEGDTTPAIQQCIEELDAYFSHQLKNFTVTLNPVGTDFQKTVWQQLVKIPYGQVASYLEIAKRLGDEKTIRAAASANGKNPIAILIPCHRVIGANGDLVGYAGGLDKKRLLLEHEGVLSKPLF